MTNPSFGWAFSAPNPPFGRVLSALITPLRPDGSLDADGAARLAAHLVDRCGHDGLLVSGTTGESPTTTDEEKDALLRAVLDAVGDRASVVAGVGTNDTAHSVALARRAAAAGAHGAMVVAPYYSKPPQAGLAAHVRAIADATDLPVMIYDIPGRSAVAFETDTLVRLAEHPRIVAVKDAKGDLGATSWVLARSDLAYYSGEDTLNFPLLALGAVGVVSVIAHLVGERLAALVAAVLAGDLAAARSVHQELLPVVSAVMTRMQGCVAVKAALAMQGLPAGPVRLPMVEATEVQRQTLRTELTGAGVVLEAGVHA